MAALVLAGCATSGAGVEVRDGEALASLPIPPLLHIFPRLSPVVMAIHYCDVSR